MLSELTALLDEHPPLSLAAQAGIIFAAAGVSLLLTFLVKVLISAPAYRSTDPDEWLKAKYDLFRLGPDLGIIGLTTYLAAAHIAYEKVPTIAWGLMTLNELITPVQFIMLLATAGFMAYFPDHSDPNDRSWVKGVWLPLVIGGASVLLSGIIFIFVIRG